ncbi:MAG: helix-turn-helix domain-containing protein [Clostridiales Family XIII bacterium]|nr:helix-turn-helix domain-containing protein [Clostridiales Family XIII bacterium]
MNENKEREAQIKRLQQNLAPIRKIAGWTAEMLGDKIGVTKQTISNLENSRTPMSFVQYLAIRMVLDHEIESNKENEVLPKVVALLLDSGDELDDENYLKVQDAAGTIAASAASGTSAEKLGSIFGLLTASLPIIIPVVGAIIGGSSHWAKKLWK